MITLTLDISQGDCPYTTTAREFDVSLTGLYSDFVETKEKLKTRMLVAGDDGHDVEEALGAFESYEGVNLCKLISKWDDRAVVKNCTDPTEAMRVVREYDGYLTAPFEVQGASKEWYLGFDTAELADQALADLERLHDLQVQSREVVTRDGFVDVVENVGTAKELLDAYRSLTDVERRTLEAAYTEEYYDRPRGLTRVELGERFDVSDTAVSNTLRRAHSKLASPVEDVDTE
jgi:predicted DNA binding protein